MTETEYMAAMRDHPGEVPVLRIGPNAETELWKRMYRNAVTALAMVREAIEMFGPATSLESQEATLLRGPEPVHEAEAICEALTRLRATILRGLEDDLGLPATVPNLPK